MTPDRHSEFIGHESDSNPPLYTEMSLKELQITIDAEILADTVADIMTLAPEKRSAAIADFAEIDPELGQRLHLAVSFAL